jgi:hypothetical protein
MINKKLLNKIIIRSLKHLQQSETPCRKSRYYEELGKAYLYLDDIEQFYDDTKKSIVKLYSKKVPIGTEISYGLGLWDYYEVCLKYLGLPNKKDINIKETKKSYLETNHFLNIEHKFIIRTTKDKAEELCADLSDEYFDKYFELKEITEEIKGNISSNIKLVQFIPYVKFDTDYITLLYIE